MSRSEFEAFWPLDAAGFATKLLAADVDAACVASVTGFDLGLVRGLHAALIAGGDAPKRNDERLRLSQAIMVLRSVLALLHELGGALERRIVPLLLEHAECLCLQSSSASAAVRALRAMHVSADDRSDSEWRAARIGLMDQSDDFEKGSAEALTLEFCAALAWPWRQVSNSIGQAITLLLEADGKAAARVAGIPLVDDDVRDAAIEDCYAKARAEKLDLSKRPREPIEIYHADYEPLARAAEAQVDFLAARGHISAILIARAIVDLGHRLRAAP